MFHFSCTVQSSSPGGIFERRICWIVCSQVLRKPQGTEKGTLCKQDVQLQQAEEKNILSPIFPNTSPIFPNIFPIFPNIFPIFPLYFPICPQYSQYFPIHPNIPPQAAGQNGPVLSPNQRRAASVRGAREDQQFRFPFSDFSRFLFLSQLLQVQTELLLPRCGQQESWWAG